MSAETQAPVTQLLGDASRLKSVISVADKLSQSYFDEVIDKVFRPSWFWFGNVNDLPEVGSYFVRDVPTFKASVLVTRDAAGVIRAFHNACRHRGKKVVHTENGWAQGRSLTHTCWFHGWNYAADGVLRVVPDEPAFVDGLDKACLGLVPICSEVLAGQIYVNFEKEPKQSLKDWLGDLSEGFEGYYSEMEPISSFHADVRANWNLAMDSFSEGYHTLFLHRSTQPELAGKKNPMRHQPVVDLYPGHVRYSGVANPEYLGPPAERAIHAYGRKLSPAVENDHSLLPLGVNRTRYKPWFFDVVWHSPNVLILNGAHWVSVLTIWPIDKDHSRLQFDNYARKARHAGDRLAQAYTRGLLISVSREDLAAMEDVQEGLESGAIGEMYVSRQEFLLQKRYALIDHIIKESKGE